MRVLLIQPFSTTVEGYFIPPFALLSVGESARQSGHTVKIIDRNIEYFTKKAIKDFNPDVVGISVFTGPMINDAIAVSRYVRETFGNRVKIVWGGIHPTLLPDQTIRNDFIDFLVIGEGEYTLVELLNVIEKNSDPRGVRGICFMENGGMVKTDCREFIKNLDVLPFVNWDLIKARKYFDHEIILLTSRGCPFDCNFCYNQEYNKRTWRGRSAAKVLAEMRRVEKITRSSSLMFFDDNFMANRERFLEIAGGLSRRYSLFIETRINYINKITMDALSKFKAVYMFVGIESGTDRMLKKMNKQITLAQIRDTFSLLKQYPNIHTTASVILGLPSETPEETLQSVRFVKTLKPSWISYFVYTPYPGSLFYKELAASGQFIPPSNTAGWAKLSPDILNLSGLAKKELRQTNAEVWLKSMQNVFWKVAKGDFRRIHGVIVNSFHRRAVAVLKKLGFD